MSDYVKVDSSEYLVLLQERDNLRKRVEELEAVVKMLPKDESTVVFYRDGKLYIQDDWDYDVGGIASEKEIPLPPSPKGGE